MIVIERESEREKQRKRERRKERHKERNKERKKQRKKETLNYYLYVPKVHQYSILFRRSELCTSPRCCPVLRQSTDNQC